MVSIPEPPGPPVAVQCQRKVMGGRETITWIEEDAPEFLRSRGILDHCKSCITSRTVVIVHRNLEIPALKVGIRGSNAKALTASPRKLGDVQEG